jgi:hypothetical protein
MWHKQTSIQVGNVCMVETSIQVGNVCMVETSIQVGNVCMVAYAIRMVKNLNLNVAIDKIYDHL